MAANRKIRLNRETLRRLTREELDSVHGAVKKTVEEWDTIIDMAQCESIGSDTPCYTDNGAQTCSYSDGC